MRGRRLTGAAWRVLSKKSVLHKVKILLYKTLIHPSVTYASMLWANKTNRKILEIMERRVFRTILNMYRNPITRHHFSNETIYECLETEKIGEHLNRLKRSHRRRLTKHSNPLVVSMMKERLVERRNKDTI